MIKLGSCLVYVPIFKSISVFVAYQDFDIFVFLIVLVSTSQESIWLFCSRLFGLRLCRFCAHVEDHHLVWSHRLLYFVFGFIHAIR
jgi:hypothetical protein